MRDRVSGYTTLRLGGPARGILTATTESELLAAVRDSVGADQLVLAGGSNVVVSDDGFPGTVILVRNRGIAESAPAGTPADRVRLTVAAGEPWDEVCAAAVAAGYSGIEALSGIPGSAGATPIQNVGAYGHEVAETIVGVRAFDRARDTIVELSAEQCGFGYRTSALKYSHRFVVLSVCFELVRSPLSAPVRYAELARTLAVDVGSRAPLADVRAAVLGLRAGKGMMLDSADHDTWSAGSFFTNPVLDAGKVAELRDRVRFLGISGEPPAWPGQDGTVKTSAGWLIERAGFHKGYHNSDPTVALSSKHALALTHRGGGSTNALLRLAREIVAGVADRFGVTLHPEPVLINCEL
jgi:UDP-N-acetylmuramate dehydrogenase